MGEFLGCRPSRANPCGHGGAAAMPEEAAHHSLFLRTNKNKCALKSLVTEGAWLAHRAHRRAKLSQVPKPVRASRFHTVNRPAWRRLCQGRNSRGSLQFDEQGHGGVARLKRRLGISPSISAPSTRRVALGPRTRWRSGRACGAREPWGRRTAWPVPLSARSCQRRKDIRELHVERQLTL
jgi:hypothetical protein